MLYVLIAFILLAIIWGGLKISFGEVMDEDGDIRPEYEGIFLLFTTVMSLGILIPIAWWSAKNNYVAWYVALFLVIVSGVVMNAILKALPKFARWLIRGVVIGCFVLLGLGAHKLYKFFDRFDSYGDVKCEYIEVTESDPSSADHLARCLETRKMREESKTKEGEVDRAEK